MVPGAGIEPARPLRTTDFKSVASAYSAIRAYLVFLIYRLGEHCRSYVDQILQIIVKLFA